MGVDLKLMLDIGVLSSKAANGKISRKDQILQRVQRKAANNSTAANFIAELEANNKLY